MVHIMVQVAKSDGSIQSEETQMIRQFFINKMQFSKGKIEWVNDTIESAKTSSDSIESLGREFSNHFEYESQLMLLNMLYNVAYADGVFHSKEAQMIDRLAHILKVTSFDHQRIKMAFEAQFGSANTSTIDQCFSVLGLPPSATQMQVKKTYRDLIKKYHPDKLQHLGHSFRQEAEKKMQEINGAYDEIMKHKFA